MNPIVPAVRCGVLLAVSLFPLIPAAAVASTSTLDSADGLSSADRAQLRRLHEAHQLRVRPTASGVFRADNPGQGWTLEFDGRGFLTWAGAKSRSWGLELLAVGAPGSGVDLPARASVSVDSGRVDYAWGPALTEWFINGRDGLQQGWTLQAPPSGDGDVDPLAGLDRDSSEVALHFRVRGGLEPRVVEGARAVGFADGSGQVVIRYGGLNAWDAAFRSLPVRFEPVSGDVEALRVVVDDSQAVYPITIDPIAQEAYLKASNPDAGDAFGSAVAVSGDVVAVSAILESSAATGINGDQTSNASNLSGAVYVFARSNGVWTQEAYLKAGNTGLGDQFGVALAMSGDTLVVGAPFEDSNPAPNAPPDPVNNDLIKDSGAAYVFVRKNGSWTQQAMLKAGGGAIYSLEFGHSVGIDGDLIAVGARYDRNTGTGIDSAYSSDPGPLVGAVYVFTRQGGSWSLASFIKPPFQTDDGSFEFGRAVAVGGKNIFVGVPRDASPAKGINGDMTQNSALGGGSGAVFAYRLGGNGVEFDAYIKASNAELADAFGYAIAASGETLAVSAIGEDGASTGVNGDQGNSTTKKESGAVYVFDRSAAGWTQTAYIKAPATAASDRLGISLALDGDVLAIGSSSTAVGPEGSSKYVGTAYVYVRDGGTWQFQSIAKPAKRNLSEEFAFSMAVSGGTLVVGAAGDDNGGTGVNAPSATSRGNSGAAYVFSGLGLPSAIPIVIQVIQLVQGQLVLDFTAAPGLSQWKFSGGAAPQTLLDDLGPAASVTETTPGHYHAILALTAPSAPSYFVRISR